MSFESRRAAFESRRISTSSSSSGSGGSVIDPLVKEKDNHKSLSLSLIDFFHSVKVNCAPDFDFYGSLKQLKSLPTNRIVWEMYNFFFQNLLGISLKPKESNEMILEHLKILKYPFSISKSAIINPNHGQSWPFSLACLHFLKDFYLATQDTCEDDEDFSMLKDNDTEAAETDANCSAMFEPKSKLSKSVSLNRSSNQEDTAELQRRLELMRKDPEYIASYNDVKQLKIAKHDSDKKLERMKKEFESKEGPLPQFRNKVKRLQQVEKLLDEKNATLKQKKKQLEEYTMHQSRIQNNCMKIWADIVQCFRNHFAVEVDEIDELNQFGSQDAADFSYLSQKFYQILTDIEAKLKPETNNLTKQRQIINDEHIEKNNHLSELRDELRSQIKDYEALLDRGHKLRADIDKMESLTGQLIEMTKEDKEFIEHLMKTSSLTDDCMANWDFQALNEAYENVKELKDCVNRLKQDDGI